MNIHTQIKQAREKKGWSMAQLALAISEEEHLKKPLAWQTIQQWEKGASAPKRKRLNAVERALGTRLDYTHLEVQEPTSRRSNPVVYGGGTSSNPPSGAREEPAVYQTTLPAEPDRSAKSLLIDLGQLISQTDPVVRDAIGSLLKSMCDPNTDQASIAVYIAALLDASRTKP